MGFFEREVNNSFDEMFDINRDGILDATEISLQYSFIERMGREMQTEDDNENEVVWYENF